MDRFAFMNGIAILGLLVALLPCIVAAHGFGNDQARDSGEYRFEFGITNVTPQAGDRVGLSFSVDNVTSGEPIPVDGLWIRISQGNDIYLASSNFQTTNETILSLSFILPKEGQYDIDVQTPDDHRATFHVTVAPVSSSNSPPTFPVITFVIGLVAGIAIGRNYARMKKKSKR